MTRTKSTAIHDTQAGSELPLLRLVLLVVMSVAVAIPCACSSRKDTPDKSLRDETRAAAEPAKGDPRYQEVPRGTATDRGGGKREDDPDSTNAEAVARAFIIAVANKNLEKAAQYVIPEQRAEIRKEMSGDLPPFPKTPDIKITIKGDRADVDVLNAKGFGLDMSKKDGKWWIVK